MDKPGTNKIDYYEPSERSDSDYISDPASDPARSEHNAINNDITYDSDTEVFNNNKSLVVAKLDYPGAGEGIGEAKGYVEEHCNLCEDAWALFTCVRGFELSSWFIESKVSKSKINDYVSSGFSDLVSVGYSSIYTVENHLRSLDLYGSYLL